MNQIRRNTFILSLVVIIALFVSACGNDEPETVDTLPASESVVVDEGNNVDTEVITDTEAGTTDDVTIVDTEDQSAEADVVATSVTSETITDTDVITQIQVLTETQSADIITETTVMTNIDVTINTDTETDTSTDVERASIGDADAAGIVIIADSAGNEVLGDALSGTPLFAGQEGFLVNDNFEPLTTDEQIVMGEGFDQNLFGEQEQDGVRQLTFNNYYIYRYVGPVDADWRTQADEFGLSPLTPQGEPGQFTD